MVDGQSAPVETTTEPAPPALPDYVLSPNAVFNDDGVQWRYGRAPDYSKTRKVWEEGKKNTHAAGSLEQIVENLVKNWEVEASFKPRLQDWRTIDSEKYTFAMSGGPGQSGEHMLKVGTYNAIIAPNEYYDPSNSDFASSHKTFKRMMPTFAWEVMEVYSGPPKVVFKWRHWGVMKNDYVGFNNKGQKVTAKAHGGPVEIFGTTVAQVDDKLRVQSLDTYMDSLDMFRQIAPYGVVNSESMNHKVGLSDALDADAPNNDGIKIAQAQNQTNGHHADKTPENAASKHISNSTGQPADAFVPYQGAVCPVTGAIATNGGGAPHPFTTQSQNDDANSSPADTEFSDSVLVSRDPIATGTLSSAPTNTQADASSMQEQAAAQSKPDSQSTPTTTTDPSPSDVQAGAELTPSTEVSGTLPRSIYSSAVTGNIEVTTLGAARSENFVDESTATGTRDAVDAHLEKSAAEVHHQPRDMEEMVKPEAGEAVIAAADSEETRRAKAEMSEVREEEGPLIMNRE